MDASVVGTEITKMSLSQAFSVYFTVQINNEHDSFTFDSLGVFFDISLRSEILDLSLENLGIFAEG